MIEIRKTAVYQQWFEGLHDKMTRMRVETRVYRLAMGNPGAYRDLKEGITELKLDHGPGYRVYFTRRGDALLLLLVGGDKSTQQDDIARAIRLAKEWKP